MRNRCTTLWLSLLVVALLGLASGAHAAQYAVVANSGNGTVSLVQNSGSGWSGVEGSAFNVGGKPWGLATSGEYAFVANNSGYLDVLHASVNGQGNASLSSVSKIGLTGDVTWVAAGSNNSVYVTTSTGDGGGLHVVSNPSGVWSVSSIATWSHFRPDGLAVVGGGTDKIVVSKTHANFNHEVQVFEDNASPVSHTLTPTGLWPGHVAAWIDDTQRFALVARQSHSSMPLPGTVAGHLSLLNVVSGASLSLELPYVPCAVAVVGSYAYVTSHYTSEQSVSQGRIYRYSLGKGGAPELTPDSFVNVGGYGGIRQITDSGDGYLLVTSKLGNTVHSVNLDTFAVSNINGTYLGAVGLGIINPVPVPEPSALATLATGLLAVAGGASRRKGRRKRGIRHVEAG